MTGNLRFTIENRLRHFDAVIEDPNQLFKFQLWKNSYNYSFISG